MAPCLTPFLTLKKSEKEPFHLTFVILVHVYEEQESDKDNRESCRDELLKEEAVLH